MLVVAASPLSAQNGPVVARAASVTGRNLLYSPASAPVALTPGYILNPGDRIDTRGGGRVVIDLSDGSMVVVQPESVIVLKDFQQANSLRELFEITVGMVRVKINHFGGRPNPYRMNSPTASIAVRGTEFSIEVGVQGDTQVVVYEGAVEVSSLSDPNRKILIEAGRGVLVQAGQDFHFIARNDAGRNDADMARNGPDRDRHGGPIGPGGPPSPGQSGPQSAQAPPPPQPQPQPQAAGQNTGSHAELHEPPGPPPPGDPDDLRPATPSAYGRFVAGLADIAQVPFLFRYNAFAERHLDSLENPAYATDFTSGEGRVFVLPSFRGLGQGGESRTAFGPCGTLPGDYRISPQISLFTPISGSAFTVGGSVSASRVGNNGTSTDTFYSGALAVARRFGANSFGLEAESLHGDGTLGSGLVSASSDLSQRRFTAGYARELAGAAKLGVFYRYALISASDDGRANLDSSFLYSTAMTGHSSEFGFRLRGALSHRLAYGLTGSWLGVSLVEGLARTQSANGLQRDRAHRGSLGIGLGYALSRRMIVSFDVAGGVTRSGVAQIESASGRALANADASRRFVSGHLALQTDVTRRLFLSASYMNVWQGSRLNVDYFRNSIAGPMPAPSLFPFVSAAYPIGNRFSDFGAGWRFSPDLFAQYLYSTDYGTSPGSHTIMLRYTFRLSRQ